MGNEPASWLAGASRRRPAVAAAGLLAGGIALCQFLPCWPWVWLIAAAALLLAASLLRRRNAPANAALLAAMIAIGLLAAQIERFQFPGDHIALYTDLGERFAQVELSIDEPPRLEIERVAEVRGLPPKQTARAKVLAVRGKSGWRGASGTILLTVDQFNPRLLAGQRVRVTGMLQRPMSPTNAGEFDHSAWCRAQRILATVRVGHADGVEILDDRGRGILLWLREKTRNLLAMGFTLDRSGDHALLRAFVLGDPDPQMADVERTFVRTGMVHYLSVSGLHVALIGAMVVFACRLMRMRPRISLAAGLAVVLLYGLVALPTWPGWRSILMCAAAVAALWNRRQPDSLQLFAVAIAAILLIHPADLHNGGFQISFAAVLGLLLFGNLAPQSFWTWWQGPDAVTLQSARSRSWLWRRVVSILTAGLIAWLMTMPLVIYHYGQLSAWSVPASLILLPMTILALTAGVLKILLTLCWPSAAHFWAILCTAPILAMRQIVEWLEKVPGAAIPTAIAPVWMLVVYYAVIALALVRWARPALSWVGRLAPVAAGVGLLLWPLLAGGRLATHAPMGGIQITLLSVGPGQCAIVRGPSNHATLIDAGSFTVSDVGRRLITPYLRFEGCTKIDRIILSHGDYDHISAAAEMFETYGRPPVFMSPHFARHAVGNPPAEELLETVGGAASIIRQGDRLDLGEGMTIDVLWPPAQCDMNSNNCGLVLALNFAGRRVIFTADIQEPAERGLLDNAASLPADVLIAPHHGSVEATSGEFLQAVRPKIILASSDRQLTHKQKTFDALASGYREYRTGRYGQLTLSIGADGRMDVDTFVPDQGDAGAKSPEPAGALGLLHR